MKTLLNRLRTPDPAPPWGLLAVILTTLVAFVAVVLGTIVAAAWLGDPTSGSILPFAQQVGWLMGAIVLALFVLQTRQRAEDRAALRLHVSNMPLPFVMFVALGAAIALDLLGLLITGVFAQAPELAGFNAANANFLQWGVAAALMLAAQPVGEELAFRGVAFPALRAMFGGIGGWLLSAVVYGGFHYLAFAATSDAGSFIQLWYGLLVPIIEGLLFGIVRAGTGSTRAAMFAHAAFGLFALAKLLIVA
jgi:membrane protease YdiL (CAAX protease family)